MLLRALDIPHVRWGLNRGNEFQGSIGYADEANNGAWDDSVPALAYDNGANEDVEDATTEEREHERGIAGHLLGDLELKESGSCLRVNGVRYTKTSSVLPRPKIIR